MGTKDDVQDTKVGEKADIVDRILALLPPNDSEFEARLRGLNKVELEKQLVSLERLSAKGKELAANCSNDGEIARIKEDRDAILLRMKKIINEISHS